MIIKLFPSGGRLLIFLIQKPEPNNTIGAQIFLAIQKT
jgi:hypothetical protein